ncbi:MAG TPA: alpha-galactosidase [Candidatus Hydrogenedentes bacterium]|nr:alpha-galactosidase [Candidatus Hydrogenedentota bacterium]
MSSLNASAETISSAGWTKTVGGWFVGFHSDTATLACKHTACGAEVSGSLSFQMTNEAGNEESWQVVLPRDSITDRLALLDRSGNIQGYVTFGGFGDSLTIQAIHRCAQNYRGTLKFDASARLGDQTFACRTQPLQGGRVVQMASGNADSRLNDSLFDLTTDTALRFRGNTVSIMSHPKEDGQIEFKAMCTASIHDPAHSSIELKITQHYYRDHYVPYYRPIDKKRCPVAPTGWMSWNVYFDTAGEKENIEEARVAAKFLQPYGMDIFSIESWQDNSPELPVSKFHNLTLRQDPNKFPSGMKWLADEIRKLGFKPGIWTVPFGTGDQTFYEAHKEWFLHEPDGKPMQNWCGLYVLDPSQEAVRKHMEETHRIMSQEWGYEYFKIDGMSGRNAGYSAHFYERSNVRAAFKQPCEDPFRLCVEALRRGIGPDRLWLACQGHYTGPEIGFADAGRIGADIVAHRRPPDWNNYSNQARTTLNQLFVNNIIWYGDPDTLLVGPENPLETVRLAATVVALTGQAMFAGDKLGELPPDRMRLLQQCLPVCDIRPLDLFPIFDMLPVWDLKIQRAFGTWDVVSLFNWDSKEKNLQVRFDELGLDPSQSYLVYDCWNRALQPEVRDQLAATVPAHGNALLAVYPDAGHPQLVYSDRHLAQGGIGIEQIQWSADAKTLSGIAHLVGKDPTELVIAVPNGFWFNAAHTGEGVKSNIAQENGLINMKLQRNESGPAHWELQF